MSIRNQIVRRVLNAYRFPILGSPTSLFQHMIFSSSSSDLPSIRKDPELEAALVAARKAGNSDLEIRLLEKKCEYAIEFTHKIASSLTQKYSKLIEEKRAVAELSSEVAKVGSSKDKAYILMTKSDDQKF